MDEPKTNIGESEAPAASTSSGSQAPSDYVLMEEAIQKNHAVVLQQLASEYKLDNCEFEWFSAVSLDL